MNRHRDIVCDIQVNTIYSTRTIPKRRRCTRTMERKRFALTPLYTRELTYRPLRKIARAIGADMVQRGLHTGSAKSTFKFTYLRLGRIRWQIPVAAFAVWPEFQHEDLSSSWDTNEVPQSGAVTLMELRSRKLSPHAARPGRPMRHEGQPPISALKSRYPRAQPTPM